MEWIFDEFITFFLIMDDLTTSRQLKNMPIGWLIWGS